MQIPDRFRKMANRHSARLLTKLQQVHDLSDLAIDAVQREMHWLAEDVVEDKPDPTSNKEEANGENYNR